MKLKSAAKKIKPLTIIWKKDQTNGSLKRKIGYMTNKLGIDNIYNKPNF